MTNDYSINGIQQVGVGVPDETKAFEWYKQHFGFNISILHEEGNAPLMIEYTGGKIHKRKATIAINLQGGSGLEIWQYVSKKPLAPDKDIQLGDFGVFVTRIQCKDIEKAFDYFKAMGCTLNDALLKNPIGLSTFFIKDPFNNIFQCVENTNVYINTHSLTGGVEGCIIGVSDIEKAKPLYMNILGYDQVLFDETSIFNDFKTFSRGNARFRRLLLSQKKASGPFSELIGKSTIELIELVHGGGQKIFKDRYWGDPGFIHLCFDISNMNALEKVCVHNKFPFVVSSGDSFEMGDASGKFCYIEDPDKTLIEFVETHKIPIIDKLGWYIDVQKKYSNKPIPKWMFRLLKLKTYF